MPVAVRPSDHLDTLQPDGGGARPAIGGIALGMTECEAVRRAGQPGNVNIGAGVKGARKVVLTYLSGPWPGIYTFTSGRLQVIDSARAGQARQARAEKEPQAGTAQDRHHRARLRAVTRYAVSSALLAASHSSSAAASEATTLARVLASSAARAGSRANKSPSASVASSFCS